MRAYREALAPEAAAAGRRKGADTVGLVLPQLLAAAAEQTGRVAEIAKEIDREIRRIIEECHDKAREIILQYQDVLHRCAAILLEREKIHRDEFEALFSQTA